MVSSDDVEEPLTPSHLHIGCRVPDPMISNDTDSDNAPQSDHLQRTLNDESGHEENLWPRRKAFLRARMNMKAWVGDMNMDSSRVNSDLHACITLLNSFTSQWRGSV